MTTRLAAAVNTIGDSSLRDGIGNCFDRERPRLAEHLDVEPDESNNPEVLLERWRLVKALHEAIAELERPYREVLVLRDIEGLPGQRVCEHSSRRRR